MVMARLAAFEVWADQLVERVDTSRRAVNTCVRQFGLIVEMVDLHASLSVEDAKHIESSVVFLEARRRLTEG
jgi:hypothetical protein